MIGFLSGKIIDNSDGVILLDVNGVGYEVNVGGVVFDVGSDYQVYIHTQLRETELSLWGFKTQTELKLFRMLTSVSGVGPKTGLLIVTQKGVNSVVRAILNDDVNELQVKGVGSKTSKKIIIELRNKVEKEFDTQMLQSGSVTHELKVDAKVRLEAVYALESLGYRKYDIEKIFDEQSIAVDENTRVEELIKQLLKYI
jgi:Holliday junction DNA helicase RuvA